MVIKLIPLMLADMFKDRFNTKINKTEGKIRNGASLATTTAFNAPENKIPHVSNLI